MSLPEPRKLTIKDYWLCIRNSHLLLLRRPLWFGAIAAVLFVVILKSESDLVYQILLPFVFVLSLFLSTDLAHRSDKSLGFEPRTIALGFKATWKDLVQAALVAISLYGMLLVGWYFSELVATKTNGVAIDPRRLENPSFQIAVVLMSFIVAYDDIRLGLLRYLLRTRKNAGWLEIASSVKKAHLINLFEQSIGMLLYFVILPILALQFRSYAVLLYLMLSYPAYFYLVYKAMYDGSAEVDRETVSSHIVSTAHG